MTAVTAGLVAANTPVTVSPNAPAVPAAAVSPAQETARAIPALAIDPNSTAKASIDVDGLLGDDAPSARSEVDTLDNEAAEDIRPASSPVINIEPNAALLALMTPVATSLAAPVPTQMMISSVQATRSPAEQQPVQSTAAALAAPAAPIAAAAAAAADPSTQQGTQGGARKPETPTSIDTGAPDSTNTPSVSEAPGSGIQPLASTPTHAAIAPMADVAQTPSATTPIPTIQPDAAVGAAEQFVAGLPGAPFEATIDPALDSAAFAPALGARIAVLARDGIEQARLNVHPADMGPITVQLALDGNQVRIDFSADMAGTRQTLEQAMPSLAASLRDAGFTLSGGGVSQQASQGQRQPDGPANGSAASPVTGQGDEHAASVTTRPAAQRETGLVDLFA